MKYDVGEIDKNSIKPKEGAADMVVHLSDTIKILSTTTSKLC